MAAGPTHEQFMRNARTRLQEIARYAGGEILKADRKVGLPYRAKVGEVTFLVWRQDASNGECYGALRAFGDGGKMIGAKPFGISDLDFVRQHVAVPPMV